MAKVSSKPKSEYAIQTVTNALRMLEVFHTEPEMGVSELARELGLHKNNAFRLLATLELAGYIQQTPSTELYHLGPRCLELGHAFARSHTLMSLARPILENLVREVGETAHLGVMAGREVVHLDGVLPDQLVLTGTRVGVRLGTHCTAIGKALLAGEIANNGLLSAGRVLKRRGVESGEGSGEAETTLGVGVSQAFEAEFPDGKLERYTDATLIDPVKLMDDLRVTQVRGYATDLEEFAVGLRCVAAPVRDASARVIAALSLSGPSSRLGEETLHGAVADAISAAASRLSSELGSPI
ncbi:MAG: IclR family transcriptional regulator [bacterium]|nr:IclR family transcriptional regulator [Deltaproteobacteria bacterium]MCP4904099.1 IclR family transcriptional regulator [bacterium]